MTTPAWRLEGSQAKLRLGALCATCEPARPDQGFRHLSIGDLSLEHGYTTAVQLPSFAAPDGAATCYATFVGEEPLLG